MPDLASPIPVRRRLWYWPVTIFAFAILLQFVRVFHGLDFNDEMQYYGEILSLVSHDRLFATDLFLQQTVYLLLYPIFKPLYVLFGTEYLILAGRVFFAAFVLGVYLGVRHTLRAGGISDTAASLSALSSTLAVPLYNIYAFSYNTVAMGLLALAFAQMFVWRHDVFHNAFWTSVTVVLAVVYPPLGIGLGTVIGARLLVERRFKDLSRFAIGVALSSAVAAGVVFAFTTASDYGNALVFTQAIGVGTAIFDAGAAYLLLIWAIFVGGILASNKVPPNEIDKLGRKGYVLWAILVAALALLAIRYASIRDVSISALIVAATGFVVAALLQDRRYRTVWLWTTILLLACGTVMVVTSGNGFKQIHGAAMLVAPFYFALATTSPSVSRDQSDRALVSRALGVGMLLAFAAIFLGNPYRDEKLWHQQATVDAAPAFRMIRTTPNKAKAVALIRKALEDVPSQTRLMIVGAHPWIYFATDARPDTDMIFMHFTGGPRAYKQLATRLLDRRPQVIVWGGPATEDVLASVERLVHQEGLVCEKRTTDPMLVDAVASIQTYYNMLPTLFVCKAPGDAVARR